MPIGWEPRGRDFPRRNRIVSGLSLGVLVVEAARKSGSLITARFALEQGREVFAVPGSPLDPRAEGTNELIRDGATLCAAAEHVTAVLAPILDAGGLPPTQVQEMQRGEYDEVEPLWDELDLDGGTLWSGKPSPPPSPPEDDQKPSDSSLLLGLLGPAPIAIDELARQAGLPIRTVQGLLVDLELEGRLARHGAGSVSLLS